MVPPSPEAEPFLSASQLGVWALAALDQVGEALALVDAENLTLVHANHLFRETFGPRALEGRPAPILERFNPDEATARLGEALDQARRGTGWLGRTALAPLGGVPTRYEGAICPVRDGAGRVASVVVRMKRSEGWTGRDRSFALAEKASALGALAGGVAHDFNNLICAILGAAEQMEAVLEEGHPARRKLRLIRQAGDRARGLTAQILNFGRRTQPSWGPVDLGQVVMEVMELLRAGAPAGVFIESRVTSGAIVRGDGSQLHQVILNLGINAWQAMQEGGGNLAVRIQPLAPGHTSAEAPLGRPCVELVVEDSGCGMSPGTLARIFEPFFTTKGEARGTGLGLAMVHSIVQAHGGIVQVSSTPGKGSAFRIYLPLWEEGALNAMSEEGLALPRLAMPLVQGRTAGD